jgi:hypothetical protein
MKVVVNVTAEDIDHGERNWCTRCPVALGLRRTFPRANLVAAHCDHYEVRYGGPEVHAGTLPRPARDFIARFDGGIVVFPFAFELEVPEDLEEAMAIPARS